MTVQIGPKGGKAVREEQTCLFEDNPEYDAFVDKFTPQKTTDDCYTPPLVYNAIKDWACKKYGIDPGKIARPFYPDGDYEAFDYSSGCVVLDNPPFSILAQICKFYLARDIPFFLFAPSLTAFSGKETAMRVTHILCDANIVYDNGAIVRTAFVTNLGGDIIAETAPELGKAITDAMKKIKAETVRTLPKYAYPDHVLTAAMLQKYAHYGIELTVRRDDCAWTSKLDAQAARGKTIFGAGLLLSDRLAAEKAAAEKAAAIVWELSDREKAIIAGLK